MDVNISGVISQKAVSKQFADALTIRPEFIGMIGLARHPAFGSGKMHSLIVAEDPRRLPVESWRQRWMLT
jgi:hypothetical protein